jgi:hypothetical protein
MSVHVHVHVIHESMVESAVCDGCFLDQTEVFFCVHVSSKMAGFRKPV